MTDYAEEQRNELEAIESIYPESFTGLNLIHLEATVSELALAAVVYRKLGLVFKKDTKWLSTNGVQ